MGVCVPTYLRVHVVRKYAVHGSCSLYINYVGICIHVILYKRAT